jgi:hypothetical protein
MSEHTPEPWSYSEQRGSPGHCTLAQVWDSYGNSLAVIEATDDEREATAIARLMAAAPELLEALERVTELLLATRPEHMEILNAVNLALQKAKGEKA